MSQVIYVDVLISVNLIVNYFILLSTSKFLRFTVRRRNIILASIIASFFSLYIFVPEVNIFISLIIKFVMSLFIVAIAFGIKNKRRLLKAIACFYSSSFGFCGIVFALWYLISANNLIIKNGIVYIDISPTFLLLATALSYIIIRAINLITGRQNPKNLFCNVKLENDNKVSQIRAKIDTGNTLKEPFSNIPVIVAEYKYRKNVVPNSFTNFLNKQHVVTNNNLYTDNNFRIIPYKVVSSEGMLPAFKPDKVIITSNGSILEREAYVAVCSEGNLCCEFEALINPELIEL